MTRLSNIAVHRHPDLLEIFFSTISVLHASYSPPTRYLLTTYSTWCPFRSITLKVPAGSTASSESSMELWKKTLLQIPSPRPSVLCGQKNNRLTMEQLVKVGPSYYLPSIRFVLKHSLSIPDGELGSITSRQLNSIMHKEML